MRRKPEERKPRELTSEELEAVEQGWRKAIQFGYGEECAQKAVIHTMTYPDRGDGTPQQMEIAVIRMAYIYSKSGYSDGIRWTGTDKRKRETDKIEHNQYPINENGEEWLGDSHHKDPLAQAIARDYLEKAQVDTRLAFADDPSVSTVDVTRQRLSQLRQEARERVERMEKRCEAKVKRLRSYG